MNIARFVEVAAARCGDRPALLCEQETLSYAGLDALAGRAAGALRDLGVARGQRVALLLGNSPVFIAAYLGVLKLVPERKPSFLKIPATQPEFFRVLLVNDRQKQAGFRSCREGFLISPNSRRTSP